MALTYETYFRNKQCDAFVDLLDSGSMDITTSGDVVLASVYFGTPAFGNAAVGVATANAITADSSCNATGTAAKVKIYENTSPDGTLLCTGTVTVTGGGGDMTLNAISIVTGAQLSITSMTVTCPAS